MKVVIKSAYKLSAVLRGLFLFTFGMGFIFLSALALRKFEFNVVWFCGFVLLNLFGSLFLFGAVCSIKKMAVNGETGLITVSNFWIIKNSYLSQNLLGCNRFRFRSKYNSCNGFFIETIGKKQVAFTEFDIINFREIRDAIKLVTPQVGTLKRNDWHFGNAKARNFTLALIALIYAITLFKTQVH